MPRRIIIAYTGRRLLAEFAIVIHTPEFGDFKRYVAEVSNDNAATNYDRYCVPNRYSGISTGHCEANEHQHAHCHKKNNDSPRRNECRTIMSNLRMQTFSFG